MLKYAFSTRLLLWQRVGVLFWGEFLVRESEKANMIYLPGANRELE